MFMLQFLHVLQEYFSLSARVTTAEVMEGLLKYRQEWMNIVMVIRTIIDKVQVSNFRY
jgi:hypothetical protein